MIRCRILKVCLDVFWASSTPSARELVQTKFWVWTAFFLPCFRVCFTFCWTELPTCRSWSCQYDVSYIEGPSKFTTNVCGRNLSVFGDRSRLRPAKATWSNNSTKTRRRSLSTKKAYVLLLRKVNYSWRHLQVGQRGYGRIETSDLQPAVLRCFLYDFGWLSCRDV